MWTAQFISIAGTSLSTLAADVVVYRVTGSALNIRLLMIATVLPSLGVGAIAGVVVILLINATRQFFNPANASMLQETATDDELPAANALTASGDPKLLTAFPTELWGGKSSAERKSAMLRAWLNCSGCWLADGAPAGVSI